MINDVLRDNVVPDLDKGCFKVDKDEAIFMHDMPAHENEEISIGMLDHSQSVAFEQAENRLHAQKGILSDIFTRTN